MILAEAALAYARRGVRIFPCAPGRKVPLIGSWTERATSDEAQVQAWWGRHPDANIGLLTGAPGYDVLDVDVRPTGNGFIELAKLEKAAVLDGEVGRVRTPSGGLHLYFPGTTRRKSRLPKAKLDYQAVGAYVVAAPSVVRIEGRVSRYNWISELRAPEGGRPLDWETVTRMLVGRRSLSPVGSWSGTRAPDLRRMVRTARPGARNSALFYAANRMLEQGQNPWVLAEEAAVAGLPKAEIEATINSALRTSGGRRGR